MKTNRNLFVAVFLLGFANVAHADVTFEELFHVAPAAAKPSLGAKRVKMLQAAVDDFNAVLNFKVPVHAKFDKNAALPADGGTEFYTGTGYRLTVMRSLFTMGDASKNPVLGYMFGPVLELGPGLGIGNSDSISRVSFYPTATFSRLSR